MNIYDISEKAGVSIATVSRVLNGNEKVSEKTRTKVLKVMEETGYQPNVFARGLGLDTMHTVGILCADSSDSYLANAVYYLEQELRRYQYDVLLCCTGYELEQRQKYAQLLLSKRVDAVIMAGSNFVEDKPEKNKYIHKLAETIPVIILNGYLEGKNIYCSACDDMEACYRVTKAFLQKKQTDILYLARRMSYSAKQKTEGFKRAYQEAGIPLRNEQIVVFDGDITTVRDMLADQFSTGKRWQVIMAADDALAIGALKYAKQANLRVPDQLQIVGYNNSDMSLCCEPELTSVDNKLKFSCMNAVTLLMQVFKGEKASAKIMISADIINRSTTIVAID